MANRQSTPGWLLSGASGLLGTALRNALAAAGQPVLRLVRQPSEPGAGLVAWNPASPQPFADPSALEGLRVAVHLSGASVGAARWTAAYRQELVASRVASTRALAQQLATLHRPPEVLVVASAVGIYGDRGEELLNERSAPGRGFLAELCRAWEAAADPARQAGIRVVHARLGVILSAQGGTLAKMLPAFRLGLGGPLGSGRQWMSWIALHDAVAAIQFLAATPSLAGSVNLVAPEPVRNAAFTRLLAGRLRRPALLPVPAFALKLAFGQMAKETFLSSQRGIPAVLQNAGFRFRYENAGKALESALACDQHVKSALS